MQHIETYIPSNRAGGRISSQRFRESFDQKVEETVNRYDLLLLVKRVGKQAGFTPRMIQLLDYYINFTRDIDWEEGGQPIVYQSLSKTALDMGVNERQIQKLEKALFEIGAITWKDSGNHKRYGQRHDKTGEIIYAYGVDITPLAEMKTDLESKLQDKLLYDQAWMETKRQISYYRSQIRACVAEAYEKEDERAGQWALSYDDIALQIRTNIKLPQLIEMLKAHKSLHSTILEGLTKYDAVKETKESTCSNVQKDAHYKYPKNKQSNKLDTRKAQPSKLSNEGSNEIGEDEQSREQKAENAVQSSGLQHITLKQALSASSDRFQEYLPFEDREVSWSDFIDAAYRLKGELGISQNSWANACVTLGRTGAAICVLLTDQALQREFNRAEKPAGYFNAMIERGKSGTLHLHNSIFGILKNGAEN